MKVQPSSFLGMLGVPEQERPTPRALTARQAFLLYGWAHWLAANAIEHHQQMQEIVARRPQRNWAILVDDDPHAMLYQYLNFRINRAKYAVGAYGALGKATYGEHGFEWEAAEKVRQENAASLQKLRDQAHRARKRWKEAVAVLGAVDEGDA